MFPLRKVGPGMPQRLRPPTFSKLTTSIFDKNLALHEVFFEAESKSSHSPLLLTCSKVKVGERAPAREDYPGCSALRPDYVSSVQI